MKVTYSRLALAELEDILARIAAENPAAAFRVRARVERVIERIK
jgi:plasmid stabilization system protein ParE